MSGLVEVAALIARESGIEIGPRQMAGLAAAAERVGHGGAEAVLREATGQGGDSSVFCRLIDEVTVQETFFLRDTAQLATIDWQALLERARRRGSGCVRVWSAACATGEEPYTLAMLAAEALGPDRVYVKILGTDIATGALTRARLGRYQPRALRHLDPAQLARHFTQDDHEFLVAPHLREMVELREHNLARDTVPPPGAGAFDLVLCRNVLIYFRRSVVERVADLLNRALGADGTLMLGVADRLCVGRQAPWEAPQPRPREPYAPGTRTRGERPRLRARAVARVTIPERAPGGPSSEATMRRGPLARAVRLADQGVIDDAVTAACAALQDDPMNAPAEFLRGTAELAQGNAEVAVAAFRRALYIDGAFAQAAFQLGRAYDALGQEPAARRAYERALRTFDPDDPRHDWLLGGVDLADLAAACRARLRDVGTLVDAAGPPRDAVRR